MTGIELIAAERKRQIEKEGWSADHDDNEHDGGELVHAAVCYALGGKSIAIVGRDAVSINLLKLLWPWDWGWWKPTPKNRIRELEKAGALIAAEIDRLLRMKITNEPFSEIPKSCFDCKSSIWLPRPKCGKDIQGDRLCTLNKNENVSNYHETISPNCPLKGGN